MHTPFSIERVYDAPVQKVWNALTDNEQLKQWYFQLPAFKAETGFEFEFTGGPPDGVQYLHHCRITEVIPGKKISYTWRYEGYEGNSLVSFELFEEGNKTRLKLTHEGLETFPSTVADFAKENFAAGWTEITGTSLRNFVEAR